MKDIYTILSETGLEVPEDKKDAFESAMRDNYKTVAEVEKITTARDSFKANFEETQTLLNNKTAEYDRLKEAAGDNEALKNQIDTLKSDFEQEKTTIQNNYEKQLKMATVTNRIITDYKPIDVKDVLNNIDIEKVTVDGDKITGLAEQVDSLKESKSYYFASENTQQKQQQSGLEHGGNGVDYSAIRKAAGLKD